MVKLHEIDQTAVFAWSNDSLPRIATGTLSGVMDDTFSSDSYLSIYAPFDSNAKNTSPVYRASAPGKFSSIDWNASGVLACGLENTTIQLLDSNKLLSEKPSDLIDARIAEYKKHTTPVLQVKFNPLQSNILASSGSKGEIFIWDTTKNTSFTPGQAISPISKISSLAWNNNMSHIFGTAGDSGYTSIWDLKAKREVLQLNYSNLNLNVIQWHPNQSTKLVTATDNDNEPVILTWDLRNSSVPEKILKGHKKGILSLDWCLSDPNLLLSSGKDDATLLWNPIEGIQLASYPSSPNWVHETKFAPKIPEIFASASLSKRIVVQTLQDTSQPLSDKVKTENENDFWNQISTTETQQPSIKVKQAPMWLKRPISANFAYGGKLVVSCKNNIKIVNISDKNEALNTSAKELITAISTKDFDKLCDSKSTLVSPENKNDWCLLKKFLSKTPTESLLDLDLDNSAEDDTISKSSNDELIDDDDFFAQISSSNNKNNSADKFFVPSGEFNLSKSDNSNSSEFESSAVDLLLSNNIEKLLDLCIDSDHIMEALLISMNATETLKEKAKNAFFRKYSDKNSFSRLLYSYSNNSISDIVQNANIESWKDIAKAIIKFSKDNTTEFNKEMTLLGDRLLASKLENARDSALSCYVISNAVGKVSNIWLSELKMYEDYYLKTENSDGSKNTLFEARFKALGEVIEKIVVFQSTSNETLSGDLSALGDAFVEYADDLVNFGHFELAYKLLSMVSDSIPEIKIEKDRIAKAFISNVSSSSFSSSTTTTAKKPSSQLNQTSIKKPMTKYAIPNQSTVPSAAAGIPPKPTANTSFDQSTNKPKRNPYVLPNSNPSPINPPANMYAPPNNLYSTSNNPYAPSQNAYTPSANPYQPSFSQNVSPAPQHANLASNPYAPKTALDSLKNPQPTNPVTRERIPPPPVKKDVGGWNDLPTHLAPVIKPTPVPAPNPLLSPNYNHTKSTTRVVSEALPVPLPPSTRDANGRNSPLSGASTTTPSTGKKSASAKNPYAPKPEVFQPPTVPVAQSPLSRMSSQSSQFLPPTSALTPSNHLKNPYAPKAPVANAYVPEPQQAQSIPPPPLSQQFQGSSFSANAIPPPPAFMKPASVPPVSKSVPPPPVVNPPPAFASSSVSKTYPTENGTPSGSLLPPPQLQQKSVANPVAPSFEPIVSILSAELEKVKPKVPEKFSKHIADAEKRLNILFKHLAAGDLLSPTTVEKLTSLSTALDNSDFAKAKAIRDEISTGHPSECGDWMVGLNRLIGMVEATAK